MNCKKIFIMMVVTIFLSLLMIGCNKDLSNSQEKSQDKTDENKQEKSDNDSKQEKDKSDKEAENVNKNASKYLEYNLLSDGTYAVSNYKKNNDEKKVVVPSEYEGKQVTAIDKEAFNPLKDKTEPYNPKESDFHIFTEVELPDTIKTLGEGAFKECRHLESINIPKDVVKIENETFIRTALTNIKWNDKVELIGQAAFLGTDFTKIQIPSSVKEIKLHAFSLTTELEEIYIPKSVEKIGYGILLNEKSYKENKHIPIVKCEAASKPKGWEEECFVQEEYKDCVKVLYGQSK